MKLIIVDADRHIDIPLRDLAPFVDLPWRQHLERSPLKSLLPHTIGDRTVGGRIRRPLDDGAVPPADLSVVFPDDLLAIGLHPNPMFEAAVALGYARWLTDVHLPAHPADRGMLYLPLSDAGAASALVAEYGSRPGVVGGFVTNAHFPRVHDNRYVGLYAALEERGLVLGFHPHSVWMEHPFGIFDQFLPVWALGQPFSQCVHLINWVLHGMGDRFPRLKCIFYEAGVCWLTFIAHRLDGECLKRPSEAPLLRERPSHYVRRCFFSTQPLDQLADPAWLEPPMRLVGCSQLVYASNLPSWDFDLPAVIQRLPFLDDTERQAILGGNAMRLFSLTGDAPALAVP